MKQKVVFVLPNVEGGGTHKVMLTLLNHLSRDKFKLHLIVVMNKGEFRRLIPSDIDVTFLNVDWVLKGFLPLLKTIRPIRPDIVLSATGTVNLMAIMMKSFLPKKTKIILRESTCISESLREPHYPRYPRLMRVLYKTLYPKADVVICQSGYMLKDLEENFRVDRRKLRKILNPVDIDQITANLINSQNPFSSYGEGPQIISAGRLCYAKNFEALISAFNVFQQDNKNARLWILGQGPMKQELINYCHKLRVSDVVFFPGFQANPYPWFKYADFFVSSSRFEGLPNVLLEALACGCPVLATDCPGGTREIMELTGNADRLMDPANLKILPEHFERTNRSKTLDSLGKHFGVSTIVEKYEQVLLS
ncbi:MAG: glycosyltransferase [Desulfomonilaceae bacterium]